VCAQSDTAAGSYDIFRTTAEPEEASVAEAAAAPAPAPKLAPPEAKQGQRAPTPSNLDGDSVLVGTQVRSVACPPVLLC
jgi:hypothetical protein